MKAVVRARVNGELVEEVVGVTSAFRLWGEIAKRFGSTSGDAENATVLGVGTGVDFYQVVGSVEEYGRKAVLYVDSDGTPLDTVVVATRGQREAVAWARANRPTGAAGWVIREVTA